jgi:hypothetical protein
MDQTHQVVRVCFTLPDNICPAANQCRSPAWLGRGLADTAALALESRRKCGHIAAAIPGHWED